MRLSDWLELHNVLLVPHFKYNVLSIERLASQLHCEVTFSEDLCALHGPSLKRPLVVGKEAFGLYPVDKKLGEQCAN